MQLFSSFSERLGERWDRNYYIMYVIQKQVLKSLWNMTKQQSNSRWSFNTHLLWLWTLWKINIINCQLKNVHHSSTFFHLFDLIKNEKFLHLEKLTAIKFNSRPIKNQNYNGEYSKDQKLRNALASCYMSLENSNEKGMALDITSSV